MTRTGKYVVLLVVTLLSCVVVFSLPPIAQDPGYHHFADTRAYLGIPNFGDVLSNLPFLVFGVMGVFAIWKRKEDETAFLTHYERFLWGLFFVGAGLVCFGSTYYHLSPANETLVWDRLSMTIAFMSLFSVIIMERLDKKAGIYLSPFFLSAGFLSVLYWDLTERQGVGDLRPYALVQFFPILALPIIFALFRRRFSHAHYFGYGVGWYVLAKLFEYFDDELFTLCQGWISGHTLKHLAASLSIFVLARYIAKREIVS